MKCFKCGNSLPDKKFEHPILKDEFVCVHCFDQRVLANHSNLNCSHGKVLNPENFSEAGIKDDIKLQLIYCSVGANSNKDGFEEEDLKKDHPTLALQRLDWEHTNEVVGVINDSHFVPSDDKDKIAELDAQIDKSFVYADALLWKVNNIGRAKEVYKRYKENALYYSMETYFDYSKCSECNEEFVYDDEYCDHLQNRFQPGSKAFRILKGNKFVGAGIVKRPADRSAKNLALAKDNNYYEVLARILNPNLYDYYLFAKSR